jgi:hypothetical protein
MIGEKKQDLPCALVMLIISLRTIYRGGSHTLPKV